MKAILMSLAAMMILGGCASQPARVPTRSAADFVEYSLDEYVATDSDTVRTDAAQWWTIRYALKPGVKMTRDDLAKRITYGLVTRDWKPLDPLQRPYTLSRIYETDSEADLHFTHGPFPGEGPDAFHHQHIHISYDARIVVCYYESKD